MLHQKTNDSGSFWTDIKPADDTRIIYVSSTEGSDENDGLSPETAFRSILKAATMMRDGCPDHMRLKCGDVWEDEHLGSFAGGRSADEPMVLTYYGEGSRPLIRIRESFINMLKCPRVNMAIIGLAFFAYQKDPADPGFDIHANNDVGLKFIGEAGNLLIEDCKLSFCSIVVHGVKTCLVPNISIRRTIVTDTYWHGSTTALDVRPSGAYLDGIDGLVIEECVFDHNGWNEHFEDTYANMYNHNLYLNVSSVGNNVRFVGNIVTRASSHGVHGRPGGLYENNLFDNNTVNLQMGYNEHPLKKGTFATARNNVILHGKSQELKTKVQTYAVWGLELADIGEGTVLVENNIVAHADQKGDTVGIRWDYQDNPDFDVTYKNNIQHKWHAETDTKDPGWLDPNRTTATYNASIGGEASLSAFLAVVCNRGLREWDERYTAYAVNAYIREGFSVPKRNG